MIKCTEGSCVNEHCCVECGGFVTRLCCCERAQELEFDREEIVKECPWAVEE